MATVLDRHIQSIISSLQRARKTKLPKVLATGVPPRIRLCADSEILFDLRK
jgi:hypothetical protein